MKTQRITGLAAAAGLLVALLPAARAQDAPGASDGLSASDWTGVRAAYEAGRHAAFAVEGGFQARNPGQQWLTRFDGRGFTVKPESGEWTWGLELRSYGVGENAHVVEQPLRAEAEGQRVCYEWDDVLEEWYVNDPRGLEHGYSVRARPTEDQACPLTFTLAVRGGLEPEVRAGGRGVAFLNAEGAAVVNYSGLIVRDATGRDLPGRFERAAEGLRLVVDDSGATYPLTIDPIAQQAYLKASNTGAKDLFGVSVSVSGDTVVVGAPWEDSNATGVNGNEGDDSALDAGAVYVFVRIGTTWSQQAYLKASNTESGELFGISVAASDDTVVVGSPGEDSSATGVNGNQSDNGAAESGAAYVFVRNGTSWSQQAYLKASNTGNSDIFGCSVAASGDTVVVGARGEGSSAMGVNGDQSNNGASGSGAAYVFVRNGTAWSQQAYLKASNTNAGDSFGFSVAVSGGTIAIGAQCEDSNATGVNGDQSNNGAKDSGAAYVFVQNGTTWSQQAYLKASNTGAHDRFGSSLSMSGDSVAVGTWEEDSDATGVNGDQSSNLAPDSGAVYVFVRNGTTWSQQAYLKASNTDGGDGFGSAVSVSGDMLVVGAGCEASSATGVNGDQSDESAWGAGAAYVFVRNGPTWTQQSYLKASNTESFEYFGSSVSVSGSIVAVGAYHEDSNATGVNGDQSNNGAGAAGAAYVFTVPCQSSIACGTGCAGSGGFIPDFTMSGCATPGESLSFSVTKGLGGSTAWLFVGVTQAALPMGAGCTLNVWPAIGPLGPLPLSGSGSGTGSISSVVAIPPTSPLGPVTVQAFVIDAGAPLGFSNSNGVWLTIE